MGTKDARRRIVERRKRRAKMRVKNSKTYAPLARADWSPTGKGASIPLLPLQKTIEVSVFTYAAVYRFAGALAGTEYRIVKRGTDVAVTGQSANRVRDLLERVNGEDTRFEFMESNFIDLNLSGEAYAEKIRNRFRDVIELHRINPQLVSAVPDKSGKRRIEGYSVRAGERLIFIPAEEMVPVKNFNPRSPYRGFSPMSGVRREVASDVEAAHYNLSMIRNGMRAGGILSPKDGLVMDEEQLEQVQANIDENNRGSDNANRLLVLPWEVDYHPDNMSIRDMDFLGLRKFAREAIAAAIGVPPMLVQNFDSATYANSEQQLKAFWDYVGKPALRRLYGAFNERLVHPDIDTDISIVPDLVGIDAMVDSEDSRVQNTTKLFAAGVITQNEARKRMNFEPVDGGDWFLVPLSQTPGESVEEIRQHEDDAEAAKAEAAAAAREAAQAAADAANAGDPPPPNEAGNVETPPQEAGKSLLSPGDRKVLEEAHLKHLSAQETKLASRVGAFLKDQQRRILSELEDRDSVPRVDDVFVVEDEAKRAYRDLLPTMAEIMKESGERALRRLGRSKTGGLWYREKMEPGETEADLLVGIAFDLGNPELEEFLRVHFFKHLTDINRKTLESLRAEFDAGVAQGEGVSEVFARLRKMPEFSDLRAEKIARTETIGAVNKSAFEAFKEDGTPLKSWLSTRDGERVRESHQDVDAKTNEEPIPMGEPFTLTDVERGSSAALMFPGDPAAPAEFVTQCRCDMLPQEEVKLARFVENTKAEMRGASA